MEELVRSAREGGEAEFRALAEEVFGRVRRWAVGLCGDPDAADEVTQRVLIALHRNLDGWDGRGRFGSWLYTVTRNAALTVMREEERYAELDESLPAEEGRHPTDRVDDERAADLVRAAFRRLPVRQREVFDLVDLQGREPSEVAERLELSPSTVRVHLHRARSAIRTRILERHPELRERYGDEM